MAHALPPFLIRLSHELNEAADRLLKLKQFIEPKNPLYSSLSYEEKCRLQRQEHILWLYCDVLKERYDYLLKKFYDEQS